MIKHIIFDLGNVITLAKPTIMQDILDSMSVPDHALLNQTWGQYHILLNKGERSSREFIQAVVDHQSQPVDFSTLYHEWSVGYQTHMSGLNIDLLALIDNLRSNYQLSLFSDTLDVHIDYFAHQTNVFTHFDHVFLSPQLGMAKSAGIAIYHHVAQNLASNPADILFVDDLANNVANAKLAGYHAIQFTSNQALYPEFDKLNLKYAKITV